jgi:flagellar biosynthetic protein FliO
VNIELRIPNAGPPSDFRWRVRAAAFPVLLLLGDSALAQGTNTLSLGGGLPNAGLSLLRVITSLALVLAVFFGGVWLFRNWQRLALHRGRAPKLQVLEARPLGNRQAIYVVAYEQQRFLVAASPTGVNLLTHLPEAEPGEIVPQAQMPAFAQALQRVLAQKA